MPSVFISRDLKPDSIFRQQLEAKGFHIQGKSLLKFSAKDFDKIPDSDWIFFYSKNGVKYFFNGLKKANLKAPNVRWATIGEATAKALASKVNKVHFIGKGNTLKTAADFLDIAYGQEVLFAQAHRSRKTIQNLLTNNIKSKELVVYTNEMKKNFQVEDVDILVFTSPLNAKAYFKKKPLFDDQKIFAIGRTTAKALVGLGIEDFNVAETPSETALVEAILKNGE